jgi:hypothetical protein
MPLRKGFVQHPCLVWLTGNAAGLPASQGRMFRLLAASFKIITVSLITGVALSALDITAADLLANAGLTPEAAMATLQEGLAWALPNVILGSFVILPVWLVIYLLRPPSE